MSPVGGREARSRAAGEVERGLDNHTVLLRKPVSHTDLADAAARLLDAAHAQAAH